jgi:hypothetical protein
MALSDPQPEVREDAVGALGDCYSRTRNPRIGRLLSSIILDKAQPDKTRTGAYISLVCLHGDGYKYMPDDPYPSLDKLDWSLVRHYASLVS